MKRKKLLATGLAILMTLSLFTVSVTAIDADDPAEYAANVLYELGLFQGVGDNADGTPNFDLNREPTREEAVTILVRLMGKDAEATEGNWNLPFTDVSDWAKPYVGYAYTNGLANGLTDKSFGSSDTVTATQYLTFLLRALGYSSDTDFSWAAAWNLTDALSITYGEYDGTTTRFTRGDAAMVSCSALNAGLKDMEQNLLSYLGENGALKRTSMVILDLEVISSRENRMDFVFFPLEGSPNTYTFFKLDKVTVNGITCSVSQHGSNREATLASSMVSMLYPEAFNYAVIEFDQAKAEDAAQYTYDPGYGATYPILLFTFECTGTLENGNKVKETFSEAIYIGGTGYTF